MNWGRKLRNPYFEIPQFFFNSRPGAIIDVQRNPSICTQSIYEKKKMFQRIPIQCFFQNCCCTWIYMKCHWSPNQKKWIIFQWIHYTRDGSRLEGKFSSSESFALYPCAMRIRSLPATRIVSVIHTKRTALPYWVWL